MELDLLGVTHGADEPRARADHRSEARRRRRHEAADARSRRHRRRRRPISSPGDRHRADLQRAGRSRSSCAPAASGSRTPRQPVAGVIESHGAAIVVRPLAPLAYSTSYRVVLTDVADLAGNQRCPRPLGFSTPRVRGHQRADDRGRRASRRAVCAVQRPLRRRRARRPARRRLHSRSRSPRTSRSRSCSASRHRRHRSRTARRVQRGSVRIEEIDGTGACVAPVPGHADASAIARIVFVPDMPWAIGHALPVHADLGRQHRAAMPASCAARAATPQASIR